MIHSKKKIYIYIFIYLYIYIYVYMYMHICIFIYLFIYLFLYLFRVKGIFCQELAQRRREDQPSLPRRVEAPQRTAERVESGEQVADSRFLSSTLLPFLLYGSLIKTEY